MVLVDVIVPSVNKVYDFQLSENAQISTVIEEICEMISQKERVSIVGSVTDLLLCDKDTNSVLDNNKTLAECNVVTGHSLIFI